MEKQYIDVTNIEENPKLFLKIYKASYCVNSKYKDNYQGYDTVKRLTPQQLANQALKDAKKGAAYAQFLVKPENAILLVCRKEGLTRRQLAELIGVRVSRLENCLSRDTVSKGIKALLQERFNYV